MDISVLEQIAQLADQHQEVVRYAQIFVPTAIVMFGVHYAMKGANALGRQIEAVRTCRPFYDDGSLSARPTIFNAHRLLSEAGDAMAARTQREMHDAYSPFSK